MFQNCRNLPSLNLGNFDTRKAAAMYNMFSGDASLNSITFGSNFKTTSVCTDIEYMFQNCSSLTALDLSSWNTQNVTYMNSMFSGASQLTTIGNVYTNWNVTKVSASQHTNFSLNSLLTNIPNFTDSRLDASGNVLLRQVGVNLQYSKNAINWTTVQWPVSLKNSAITSLEPLTIQFTTDLSLNALTKYFITDSSNITIDGSNNIANININSYPGLIKNGMSDISGNSNITVQNIGVVSTYTVAGNGGWVGQQYFGNNATDNFLTNCYSTGPIGTNAGGIFGSNSSGSINNCYSIGTIDSSAGGIFGANSYGSSTNCYSTGSILSYAGGIFGSDSSSQAQATNCYSSGDIGQESGGIFGQNSQGSATDCYYTDGSANWSDINANAALDVSGSVWTDINLSSQTVPYFLSAFTETLYNPSSATDASSSNIGLLTDCSYSIVSVNNVDPFIYPSITINSNTGVITLGYLQNGIYEINVLAINANGAYSFGTFTNTSTSPLDASGSVLLRQEVGSDMQYSNDGGVTWTTAVWPLSLINSGSSAPGTRAIRAAGVPLIMTFTEDIYFDSSSQYFIIDSSNITIDGSNNVVYIDVSSNDYPGVFQNGTVDTSGNSYVTIQNLGVDSSYSLADYGGWVGQSYFGNGATDNLVTNCYSTGTISGEAGGIFGYQSSGSATNCYSIGTIGFNAGGIFGAGSESQSSATNCYSTGDISGNAGGIFGQDSSGSATNCYSIGTITGGSGIGGTDPSYCYYTNGSANWLDASANDALDVSEPNAWTDIDLNSDTVPYLLSAFTNTLYDPYSETDASESGSALLVDCSYSIVSVNDETPSNYPDIAINSNTGDISFNSVSYSTTYVVNVLARNTNDGYSFGTFTNIISNICFPAGTPIVTNQGIIAINKINPAIHTIRNKKIVSITKTVSPDKYLVRFEKDALGANLPSEATTMTQNHMLFYKGKMMKAKEFVNNESVAKVPYNGQVLYNVLMEEHDKMVVNNLICETLHPENYVAKMYHAFKVLTPKQRIELIKQVNKEVLNAGIYKKPTSKSFTFSVSK
jgi:surface protein